MSATAKADCGELREASRLTLTLLKERAFKADHVNTSDLGHGMPVETDSAVPNL